MFGAPCWVSLMTGDLDSAQQFYGAVLGWHFRRTRLGDGFSIAFRDGAPVAGVGALAQRLALPAAWTPYFAVDDADVTAARIVERGATMAVGPLAFGTGRAALASDPDGAVFGFWQGQVIPDWTVGQGSAPAWLELRTRDAFAAAVFYGEVLEWAGERPGGCTVSYEHDHVVLRHGNDTLARIVGGALEEAPIRRSDRAGTSISASPTSRRRWKWPPVSAVASSRPWTPRAPAARSPWPIPTARCSPWWPRRTSDGTSATAALEG